MQEPSSPENMPASPPSHSDAEALEGRVSLFLRLWTYGGPSQPPSGLVLAQDPEISALLQETIREGQGQIAEQQPELWCGHFDDALHALTAAKTLQQRFLTFHRKTEPQQVVPSILIYPTKIEKVSGPDDALPEDMLANVTSAQILIAGSVFERMKTVPGFRFNPKPVRDTGETFGPEPIYELLWTDESTYGHLRQASRAGLKTVGRYQIQEELGRGAMGAVYKAYDELIGRTVALKTIAIDRHAPNREALIERLKQEAKAAGGLDHPNIITIYDVGQEEDVVYLSMQYVKGTTLAALLIASGVPSLATFLSWADQICSAVGYAHERGVIHRDLKPANLMVTEQGIIKILDFGIAKIDNTSLTQTGLVVGTPSYMAPETLAGKKSDQRADIFSLGSVFYELLTREKPFHGDVTTVLYKIMHEDPVAPSLVNPAVPGGIDAVIRKALVKDPKERFQKCEEMRAAFTEQAARLNLSPSAISSGAIPVVPPKPDPTPTPKFLVVEAAPKPRRALWPQALVLAVAVFVGWVGYVRTSTGAFPPFINKALERAHGPAPAPQKPVEVKGAAQDQPDQGVKPDASGNAAETAPPPSNGPNATVQPATYSPDAGSLSVQPATGTSAGSQPVSDGTTAQPGGVVGQSAPPATPSNPTGANPPAVSNTNPEPSAAPVKPARPLVVDGFSKKDVPQLLRVAEVAARRGDNRLARYEYNLILRLDQNNAAAHNGLRQLKGLDKVR